jgi:RNA polymerase sigma-70 factor (ECF subfamily)
MQDKDLVRRAKDGDPQALDQLIARFDRYVFGVALLMLSDRAEAQDAAQEALVKAVRGLQSFNGKASLRTWLYRITVNACRDALRRRARRREVSLENTPLPARDSALQTTLDRERRHTVWQAVQALDAPLREVVVLRYYLELPCAEIGKVTGAPTNTIYWRLHQARRELELLLADDLPTEEGAAGVERK